MARPQQRTAAKDYPQAGISKGDKYWYVKIKTGPRSSREMRQKTPFKRSQLTQSDYLSQLYDWEDELAELGSMDEAENMAETIENLGSEQREKFDNMPEGLQQGASGQMLERRAEACEAAAEAIREVISEWESAKDQWDSEIEDYRTALADYKASKEAFDEWEKRADEADDRDEAFDEPEPTVEAEPDLPDYTDDSGEELVFDEDKFLTRVKEVSVDE